MPLKLTLKLRERIIIAGAAITNGGGTANLIVENNVPILREKDILTEEKASSPACGYILLCFSTCFVLKTVL